MLRRFTVIMLIVSAVMLIAGIFGATIVGSFMSPRTITMAVRFDYFLTEYAWALRLWRYTLYAGLFVLWPALGRKARARDTRDWTDQDVRDWDDYRYRLLFILVAIDVAIIDQWFYRLLGLT